MAVASPSHSTTQDAGGSQPGPIIGRRTAISMIACFLALIAIPPFFQLYVDLSTTGRWRFLVLFETVPTHESLKRFEDSLAQESVLATKSRLFYRQAMMRWLRQGSEKVVVGRDGFLFYLQEVEMAAGPRPAGRRLPGVERNDSEAGQISTDAAGAIADFARQLRERGIPLVFVPLPVKPFIYPERVWPDYPVQAGPAWSRDREALKTDLARSGVDVLDITEDLWNAKAQSGDDLFLKLDTHWTPRGVAVVADRIADHVRGRLHESGRARFSTRASRVTNFGDMLRVLEIDPSSGLFSPQSVEIAQVHHGDKLASGDDASPVLLLGDSFTNIYRRREMDWGEGAGLGEQIMRRLGVGVQVIAINGGGATAVRETLARKPGALEHKQVVVWACTARDFYDRAIAWERVPLGTPAGGLPIATEPSGGTHDDSELARR